MKTLTLDEATRCLSKTLRDVCRDHEPVMITREDGESVVMLSLADHNSMVETLYLLGNGKNAEWLRGSVAQFRNHKSVVTSRKRHSG